ncbi:MAG: penicillin-binding transpeptidase domain-containing protein [Planctomycetota bacterium]|nr:penicillin-binding transpeptidase domain-containing protein [Planctomycetota bacterium]
MGECSEPDKSPTRPQRGGAGSRRGRRDRGVPFVPASAASPVGASGLRPASLFAGIAVVFLIVAGRAFWMSVFADGAQPDATRTETAPTPGFAILDRTGRPLAMSVECFDLTVSPRALLRAHTPDRIARGLSVILSRNSEAASIGRAGAADEQWPVERVLERMMPASLLADGPHRGRLVPAEPRMLAFDDETAGRVSEWLDTGVVDPTEPPRGAVRGMSLVRVEGTVAPTWTLAMEPIAALGREAREDQFGIRKDPKGREVTAAPDRWTRRMLDALIALVGREAMIERLPRNARLALEGEPRSEVTERLRNAVWAELVPTRFRVLARAIDPVRAHEVKEFMRAEGISSYQVALVQRVERRHPPRPGGAPVAPHLDHSEEDAVSILGPWGLLAEARALAQAERDRLWRPHVIDWEDPAEPFAAHRDALISERRPRSGVELLCQTVFENGPWAPLVGGLEGRVYERRSRHVPRDRQRDWGPGVPDYFKGYREGTDVPPVEVTLDARLQEVVHAELRRLMEEHDPALAMAIAVDVESGDVLAVDSASPYDYSGFAPLLHEFTPGSTFKAIIMALALDAGVTTPDELFPTFRGAGLRLGGRTIREAEGAPTEAKITAAEGLAHSCNAVLVQIALRIEASQLRDAILRLGYGARPGAGLGPERDGYLTPLQRGTWRSNQTHASVGFGHELTVTLWQHAAGLATMLRGGVRRPLRLVRALERDGRRFEAQLEGGEQVLAPEACRDTREMMALGAEIGTGDAVAKRAMHPEFSWIGTKTGTTEKVPTELCVHLELEALERAARDEVEWTRAMRRALSAQPPPHGRRSCYTSSMCAVARAVDVNGEEREVMVLVVADDPRGRERFGSRVSGPTAIAILRQAFGFSRVHEGESPASESVAADVPPTGEPIFERGSAPVGTKARSYDARWLDTDEPWEPREDEAGSQR